MVYLEYTLKTELNIINSISLFTSSRQMKTQLSHHNVSTRLKINEMQLLMFTI